MGLSVLSATVLLAVLHVTRATSPPLSDGFSMLYYIGTNGPYNIKIEDPDLARAYEDMCDVRTLVHNRTFHHVTGTTLSFKTKRIIEDSTVYHNLFWCQIKETYTLSCRRMNRTRCYPAQTYFEFRSIIPTPANCRCVGICFSPNLANVPENDYFVPQNINLSQCEERLPPGTPVPTGGDVSEVYTHKKDISRDDRDDRVDARIPIIIGAVMGTVVLALLVVVMILVVSMRQAKCCLTGKPLAVQYVMFPKPEMKPNTSREYTPMYSDEVERGNQPPQVEEPKTDMEQQTATATNI